MISIADAFRAARDKAASLIPTDSSVIIKDNSLPDTNEQSIFKSTLANLASKLFALINAGEAVVTPLIDDGDAGVTVTSADQTHAEPVVTIPDIGDAADEFVMKDTTQTLTNKTLTSPIITAPAAGTTGIIQTARATLAETALGVSHVATIPVPAGAIIHSIKVIPRVLWGAGAAVLKVGDTADDDGFFVGVDLKATDALVGEVLETNNDALWGGKEGAYLVAATGRRGPTANNFGMSYVAGSDILVTVTVTTPAVTTGRTDVVVEYSVPKTITPVVS